ncbi:hypothetical protein C8R42DRAFT_169553 [Lentinula raphanica]|nr:hypothetical protein C8R42DRAFT_169553 [Lentinula raphanica]
MRFGPLAIHFRPVLSQPDTFTLVPGGHTHTTSAHTHSAPAHTHIPPAHTHYPPAHTHLTPPTLTISLLTPTYYTCKDNEIIEYNPRVKQMLKLLKA